MKTINKVKHLNITINQIQEKQNDFDKNEAETLNKMHELVETLRIIALDKYFENKKILIPYNCEKYGFVEGEYKLPDFLYFIADMLEE